MESRLHNRWMFPGLLLASLLLAGYSTSRSPSPRAPVINSSPSHQVYSGTNYGFNSPYDIVVDASGNVWVTNDSSNSSVTELKGIATPLPFSVPLGQ